MPIWNDATCHSTVFSNARFDSAGANLVSGSEYASAAADSPIVVSFMRITTFAVHHTQYANCLCLSWPSWLLCSRLGAFAHRRTRDASAITCPVDCFNSGSYAAPFDPGFHANCGQASKRYSTPRGPQVIVWMRAIALLPLLKTELPLKGLTLAYSGYRTAVRPLFELLQDAATMLQRIEHLESAQSGVQHGT